MRALALVLAASVAQIAVVASATSDVAQVVVEDFGPMGTYGGREYTWVTGHIEGVVHRDDGITGHYRVPVSLFYPDSDSNGFGFVDVIHDGDVERFVDHPASRGVLYPGDAIFSDFLRREGFTYIAVQHSRTVTYVLGPNYGVIENGADGYEIITDAARLIREPDALHGVLAIPPRGVDYVVGFGISSTVGLIKSVVLYDEDHRGDGAAAFDGLFLASSAATGCGLLTNDETPQAIPGRPAIPTFEESAACPRPMPDDVKIILIRSQTDLERRVDRLPRWETPGYRVYEIAGVPHAPEGLRNFRHQGATRQNPASWVPVAKAMLHHLAAWIATGREPPPPLYLEGTGEDGAFALTRDADGNVLGGIRLPHMRSVPVWR